MGTGLPRRINLLWVLAALLGAAAVHGTFRAVHHPEPSAAIMHHFAEAAAEFATSVAEGRLEALARRSLPPGGGGALKLHLVSDSSGGEWAFLSAAGGADLRLDARALAEQLFQPDTLSEFNSALTVATASGAVLYRTPGPDQPYHATIHPRGVLAELAVTSALAPPTGMLASFQSVSRDQLWVSGVLLLCTVLVTVIAAISSRREALLARARSDFIAGVSHELRMPLAQILLASETLALEREPDAKRQLGLANSIVREARRLAGLVDNVLLVARSGAVRLSPTLAAVPVESLFAEVEESVHLAVEDAGQQLQVRAPQGIAVQGDRQLLRQALSNLIDNALKYGRPGSAIRLGAEAAVGGEVHLYVENDGPGIPPSLRAGLFQPYERLPRDQTSERTGSGLGLAVVAQIARTCGGRVWLEDGRPEGTRAVLALGAARADPAS